VNRQESGQVHGPRGASPDSLRGISPSRKMKRGESYRTDDSFFSSFDDMAISFDCLPGGQPFFCDLSPCCTHLESTSMD
jgi:hypothetical protein